MAAEQSTSIQVNVNAQPFTDGLKSATAAAQQFETSINELGNTTQKTQQQINATAAGFATFQRSIDPAARAAQGFASDIAKIQTYYTGGFLKSQSDVNNALDLSATKWKQTGAAAAAAKAQLAQSLNLPAPQVAAPTTPASGGQSGQDPEKTIAAFNQLAASLDPVVAAEQKFAAIQAIVNEAIAVQPDLLDKGNAMLATAQQRYSGVADGAKLTADAFNGLMASIDPATAAEQRYAEAAAQIQKAYQSGFLKSQEDVNNALDLAAAKYNTTAYQAEQAAQRQATAAQKSAQQQAASFAALEAQLDPAVAKQQQFTAIQTQLNAAVASGATTQQRANTLLASATTQFTGVGNAARFGSMQMVLVGDQFRQMADQMISGGGFLRPVLIQVPTAISLMGGLGATFDALKSKVGAIVSYGGLAALGAALVVIGVAAEHNQEAIIHLSNGLSKYGGDFAGTAQTINAAARDLAATTSLGTQEARDAIATLAAAPGFTKTKENFENTLKVAQTFSVGFGETLQQAASRIGSIFADPLAAALQYADQSIQGFDGQFIQHIQLLVNSGKKVEAINEVYDKLRQAFTNVNTAGTPLQAALKGLNEAFTAIGNGAGGASGGIGTGLTNALAGAINSVTALVKGIDSLLEGMSKIGISSTVQGGVMLGAFALMLPPVQKLIGLVISLVSWLSKIGPAASAAAAATTAATAAEAGVAGAGAAVAGVGAAGAGAAAAEGVGAAAFLAGIPIVAIVAAVLATGGALIWAWFKNSGGQADFQQQALAAGFQQYKTGTGLLAENPRYKNPVTGEDFSSEQMAQRLAGQTIADSVGTRLDHWLTTIVPPWLGGAGGTIQQLGAQPAPGSLLLKPLATENIPAAGQPYAQMFADKEKQYGLPPGILAGIANIETGGTYDPNILNKQGSGALGMMQILKSTAEKPGYGITPIAPDDRKNPAIAIDFAAQMLAKVAAANGGSLAAAVKLYSGGEYSLDPSLSGLTVGGTSKAPAVAVGPAGPASGPTTAQQDITKILYGKGPGQGLADLTGLGNAGTADAIQHNIAQLEVLKTSAGATADQIDGLNKVEEQQRAALENLKTPFQKTVEQQQQQLALDTELNPATKQVIQAQQQLIDSNRQLGKDPPTAAELAAVRSGVLNQLSAQYNGVVAAANQEAAATNAVAAAWDKGAIAADHATNVAKAYQQIVGASPNPTVAQLAAVQRLTDAYDKQSAALEKVAAKQSVYNSGQQLKVLNAQEGALGTSATNQAVVAAQAQKAAEFKDPTTPEAQQAIQAAGQVAAKTVNVDREKQAWASVDQAATSAIDDIGSGLEDVLSTGKWTGFADAAKKALGDISKELLNLALLNPLKNLLTGGRANAPSLFDLFNGTGNSNNPLSNGGVLSGGQVSGGSSSGGSDISSLIGSGFGLMKGPGFLDKAGLFGSEGPLFGSGAGAIDTGAFDLGAGAVDAAGAAGAADAIGGAAGVFDAGLFILAKGGVLAANGDSFAPISDYSGTIVNKPTPFTFGRQSGLMGEAGSEAVLPMMRGGIQTTAGHVLRLGRTGAGQLAVDHMHALSALTAASNVANDNLVPQYHSGGLVGQIGGIQRNISLAAFAKAPRYHTGGVADTLDTADTLPPQFASDEIPAVLKRSELVMTQAQQRAVANKLGNTGRSPIINQHFNISTPDADSFRASKSQVQVEMARAMARASRRM